MSNCYAVSCVAFVIPGRICLMQLLEIVRLELRHSQGFLNENLD